jgi:hypothetical protein
MTAASTQGSKISYAKQSAFGTPQTTGFKDIRVEGEPTAGTPVGEGNIPNTVFADPNQNDKPIIIKKAMESAFTIGSLLRQPASVGGVSWAQAMFESGGYTTLLDSVGSTVDTGSTAGSIIAASDNFEVGEIVLVELDNGEFVHVLIAAYSAGTITPAMDLPSIPSVGNTITKVLTVTPGNTGSVAGSDLLTVKATIKAQDGGSDEIIVGQDVGLMSLADLNLEPGETVVLEATLGASDLSGSTGALGSNDFADSELHTLFNEPYFQFAAASASGGISAAYNKIMSATFTWNVTCEQTRGLGDPTCKNNIQGYMQTVEPCKLVVEMLYDSDKLDDFAPSTNASKYIGIIQPAASALHPSFSLFIPNAHQVEAPKQEAWTNTEHRVTVTYTGRPAGFNSTTTADQQGNQAFYFGLASKQA